MSSGFSKCSKLSFVVGFPLFPMEKIHKFILLLHNLKTRWVHYFNLHSNPMFQKAVKKKPAGGDSG